MMSSGARGRSNLQIAVPVGLPRTTLGKTDYYNDRNVIFRRRTVGSTLATAHHQHVAGIATMESEFLQQFDEGRKR